MHRLRAKCDATESDDFVVSDSGRKGSYQVALYRVSSSHSIACVKGKRERAKPLDSRTYLTMMLTKIGCVDSTRRHINMHSVSLRVLSNSSSGRSVSARLVQLAPDARTHANARC